MNDSVLITGGNGFLGKYIARHCLAQGYRVYCVARSNDPGNIDWARFVHGNLEACSLEEAFVDTKFKFCFHLAASSHVPLSVNFPYQDFLAALPGTANLLLYLAKHQADCHCIVASSAAVYGEPTELPITEEHPLCPISPYGIHKKVVETLAAEYARLYGIRVSVMRIFSAYGTGLRKQLLWDIAMKINEASRSGQEKIGLFGTGEETRDYVHASDIARAALNIAQCDIENSSSVFNVASGKQTTVRDVAATMLAASNTNLGLEFSGASRTGDPAKWQADCTKLKTIGFTCEATLRDEIERYFDWACSVQELDR
ncbi:NAD-dependent epimerase/dehydratase family protein [Rhodopirellula halodulae]|uniref:NAD-dependent epimerase/dehydratase family protein n=1 Tax=Rhodopirellula halodulae TaxID=2894198 RepID=UPI001E3A6EEC|nr:NAD(P)-dependent oxidoreductase [Rhodopirellula sp. JC737]MCC9656095.1 NAD(P)-dependent oxidoreductase [Rhodopirellula sp. JC737]